MVGYVTVGTRVSVSGRDGENGTARRGVLQHHYLRSNKVFTAKLPSCLTVPLSLGAGAWPNELCLVSTLEPYSLALQ